MSIEARYHGIGFSARVHKSLSTADSYFFQRLEAITDKCGTEDQQFFDPFVGHLLQSNVSEWFQPTFAQPRLEGIAVFPFGYIQEANYFPGRGEALMAVAGGMRRRRRFTTGSRSETVRFGGVGLFNMSARYAMIRKQ